MPFNDSNKRKQNSHHSNQRIASNTVVGPALYQMVQISSFLHTLRLSISESVSMITDENVYKVCDVPHPVQIRKILENVKVCDIRNAMLKLNGLLKMGFSTLDFIGTLFRVTKTYHDVDEKIKLEWIRDMAFVHARIADGLDSPLQLNGLLAKMCLSTKGMSTF